MPRPRAQLDSAALARAFAFEEPNYRAGVYSEMLIRRFENTLGRTMWEFPGEQDGIHQLVISHATEPLSFVAQRAQSPNELGQLFGPIAFQLVRKGPTPLSAPVRFRESVDMYDRALFAPK